MYTYKKLYTLDFTHVKNHFEMHLIIKNELDFPDYYGCNLDALWDCLTDMVSAPIHIEIIGFDAIERISHDYAQKMIEVFKDLKHYNNDKYSDRIVIEIVSGDTRVKLK